MTPYSEVRHLVKTGDLLATAEPGLVSRGIRRVTHSQFSHVCGAVWIDGRLLIGESHIQTGVVLVAVSEWLRRLRGPVWWWPACLDGERQQQAYRDALLGHLGDRYESPKWMGLKVALGLKPPANERWYCSELETRCREDAGADVSAIPERQWPEDVARLYGGAARAVRIK